MCCKASTFSVARGEIVCLIGANGAGKTTTLRTIMALIVSSTGRVVFDGADIRDRLAHLRNRFGLGYPPEERRIVAGMKRARFSFASACWLGDPRVAQPWCHRTRSPRLPRAFAEWLDQVAATMSAL